MLVVTCGLVGSLRIWGGEGGVFGGDHEDGAKVMKVWRKVGWGVGERAGE